MVHGKQESINNSLEDSKFTVIAKYRGNNMKQTIKGMAVVML
jgi:hypothetical protein